MNPSWLRPILASHPAALLLLLASVAASGALAQPAPSATPAHPCEADVARLCPGLQPGHGRIRECLRDKTDQLSPECKAHVEQARQQVRAAHEACQGDVAKLCPGVSPGGGRIAACLRDHASELSGACKAQRFTAPGKTPPPAG